jgi:MFS transporter, ACS family, tartrate transporter
MKRRRVSDHVATEVQNVHKSMNAMQTASADPISIHRRNAWHVLPTLVAGYVLCALAKTNIGFASLQMNADLGFTPEVFGFGAGLFFVTYTLFEIPSNLVLRRLGSRVWLSRILITWGVVSMATALTHSRTSFYVLRLLLGLAEAGWVPGVIFYLSMWFPETYRARAITIFLMGVPIAAVLGNPISGALVALPVTWGLRGWQWLFIVEGLPSVLLGLFALRVLSNTPTEARWLTEREKTALAASLASEYASMTTHERAAASGPSYLGRLGLLCCVNFASGVGLYDTFFWLPQIVKQLGALTDPQTGFVTAVPFLFSAAALIGCAWSSDRRRERKWHSSILFLGGATAMGAIGISHDAAFSLGLLTLSMMAVIGVQGILFTLFSESLRGAGRSSSTLAASVAAVTTAGNLGGLLGSVAMGKLLSRGADLSLAPLVVAASFGTAGALLALMPHRWTWGVRATFSPAVEHAAREGAS